MIMASSLSVRRLAVVLLGLLSTASAFGGGGGGSSTSSTTSSRPITTSTVSSSSSRSVSSTVSSSSSKSVSSTMSSSSLSTVSSSSSSTVSSSSSSSVSSSSSAVSSTSTTSSKPSSTTTATTTTYVPGTKTFTLNLATTTAALDGYSRPQKFANGVPDYVIRATMGDTLKIVVNNNLDVETSLHWHGMFQRGTPWYDGAAMITQCPIAPGASFTYLFSVPDQAGTYWWHAHYKSHYSDGLRGPLIIDDPADPYRSQYDDEIIVTLTDQYHKNSSDLLTEVFLPNSQTFDPVPDSGLINSIGRFDCSKAPQGSACTANNALAVVAPVQNKRYRLRIINQSVAAMFNFSVDAHTLNVIEADGVYTIATNVTHIPIGSAQRYSAILTADQAISNYWIRATINTDMWTQPGAPIDNGLNADVRAVLRYSGAQVADPTTSQTTSPVKLDPYSLGELNGLLPSQAPNSYSERLVFSFTITENLYNQNTTTSNVTLVQNLLSEGFVNVFGPNPLKMRNYGSAVPLTAGIASNDFTFPDLVNVAQVTNGTYVLLQIRNDDPFEHVFHLHGHTFWVLSAGLAQGSPPTAFRRGINRIAPFAEKPYPRRDSVLIPSAVPSPLQDGSVTILIKFDNPGVWLFHCHVDFHMATGLSMMFVNSAGLSGANVPAQVKGTCSA